MPIRISGCFLDARASRILYKYCGPRVVRGVTLKQRRSDKLDRLPILWRTWMLDAKKKEVRTEPVGKKAYAQPELHKHQRLAEITEGLAGGGATP